MKIYQKFVRLVAPMESDGKIRWKSLWVIYSVANLYYLLTWNALFWDAWYLYQKPENIVFVERNCPIDRCKVPFVYLFEQPLIEVGVWTLKALTILSFALGGWIFWKILGYLRGLTEFQRSLSTILFLLLPINGARVGLSTVRASLLLTIFLLGVLFLIRRQLLVNFVGLTLVFYACFWQSFQVYLIVVPALLLMIDYQTTGTVARRTWWVTASLSAMPFVHQLFVVQLIVDLGFAGPDSGYNNIRASSLLRALLVCGVMSAPLTVQIIQNIQKSISTRQWTLSLVRIGLALLALGSFPYMVVGHFATFSDWVVTWLPDTSDWNSRHQLLQGPGFALIFTGLASSIVESRRHIYASGLIIVSVIISVFVFSTYYVDALKQRDFIEFLQSERKALSNVNLFLVVDDARDLNARGRTIRDNEWQSIFELVLERPLTVTDELTDVSPISGCETRAVGKVATITRVSGRLRPKLFRNRVVDVAISDLISC